MRHIVFMLLIGLSLTAQAQYRCEVGGKSVYSDVPCGPNAKKLGGNEDRGYAPEPVRRPVPSQAPAPKSSSSSRPECAKATREGSHLTVSDECR